MRTFSRSVVSALSVCTLLIGPALITSASAVSERHGEIVQGRILETYQRLGGYRTFGNAITPERTAGRGGKFQVFERASSIYWHPNVSNGVARQVGGSIRDKWRDWGWENGDLRYPTTDETATPDRIGRYNHFENGSIYWTPSTNAQVVQGQIKDRWANQGWEKGTLGYPTTSEASTPDGIGRFNHFQNGSIYWTPGTGPQIVKGRIRDYWEARGWEKGPHGYPTGEEIDVETGKQQKFENLDIQWVRPNPSPLPYGDTTDWDGYSKLYSIRPVNDRWTAESVTAEFTQHFDAYFTFTGCGNQLRSEQQCKLDTVGGPQPIKIVSVAKDGFAFKSLPGHFEGAGRTISFRFYNAPAWGVGGENQIFMEVRAWGPSTGASKLGPLNSETLANYAWSNLARNLRGRLVNSSVDYLTSDKYIPSARAMSLQNPVGPSPESEYIDADQLAAEWTPDEFPLVDLNDPVSLEGIPETVLLQLQQEQANRDSSTPLENQ
ncbi:LGFP repeat-containing protein [Corynebacterium striatum]